jgi:RNA polymerase sigma-B factor
MMNAGHERLHGHRIADDSSSPRADYADVMEMFRHLQALDAQSAEFRRQRDAIIERCLPLANNIARRFGGRGEAHEDLVQVARLGLVNAVKRFDVSAGSGFLSFAVPTIMGEVRRHFRDHGWAVRVPRRLKELSMQLAAARAELSQQLNRAPTASELAVHIGADREEVVEALIAANAYTTKSTDEPSVRGDDDDDDALLGTLGGVDANLDKVLDVETLRPLLAALPDRERTIVLLRFFENMTQTQIAERLGISQMHVSRLLTRTLTTLRHQAQQPQLI